MTYALEVFSPIPGKGLDREYVASAEVQNESNYIELGLVVRDEDGNILDTPEVTVECTDESQNKVINGTGNYSPNPKVNGKYYHFHYEFRTPENHIVTFKVGDESIAVGMNAR